MSQPETPALNLVKEQYGTLLSQQVRTRANYDVALYEIDGYIKLAVDRLKENEPNIPVRRSILAELYGFSDLRDRVLEDRELNVTH